MDNICVELARRLQRYGQEHLVSGWDQLTADEQRVLHETTRTIDFEELQRLYAQKDESHQRTRPESVAPLCVEPADTIRPTTVRLGEEALACGEVAVLLVAGGQGSRLGFDKPKGMYPIGPVSGKSLFQLHAEKVFALGRRYGRVPPLLVMTSPAVHAATEAYFEENNFFGLPQNLVTFFQQGVMPALDLATGRLLIERPGVPVMCPNGHGGSLTALAETGLLERLLRTGVRHLFYFQVDNPLVNVCDPAFVGRHIEVRSEISSKVIEKTRPGEKVGVLVGVDGRHTIVEYTDLPESVADERARDGGLLLRAGNPAIHLFDLDFLLRIVSQGLRLPFHIARKRVAHTTADGRRVEPTTSNALKFERFIFDVFPLAERWLALWTNRREEFAPLKSAEGNDSPATVRQAISNLAGDWLQRSGVPISHDVSGNVVVPLEVSPRFALSATEFATRVSPAFVVRGPWCWE